MLDSEILTLKVFSQQRILRSFRVFYRRISIQYRHENDLLPCPIKWLDNFSMRNFTNDSIFDDTLPVADGWMEIGERVPVERLHEAMEDWFRRKSYLPKESSLVLQEDRDL